MLPLKAIRIIIPKKKKKKFFKLLQFSQTSSVFRFAQFPRSMVLPKLKSFKQNKVTNCPPATISEYTVYSARFSNFVCRKKRKKKSKIKSVRRKLFSIDDKVVSTTGLNRLREQRRSFAGKKQAGWKM